MTFFGHAGADPKRNVFARGVVWARKQRAAAPLQKEGLRPAMVGVGVLTLPFEPRWVAVLTLTPIPQPNSAL